MSLVSTGLSLTQRTRTQRDQNAGSLNAAGAPSSPDWQDNLTGLPCRFWYSTAREQLDPTTSVEVGDMRMIVKLGTDVTEQDRLAGICDKGGDMIVTGPIGIRAVVHRKDHLELFLVRIGS